MRQFAYDGVSRLIGSNNPESASAASPASQACAGTASGTLWTTCYSYDNNGNAITKRDNRGVSITYAYDALNRLLSKSYSDSTPSVSYSYDVSAISGSSNDVGQMTQATVQAGSSMLAQSKYAYDPMERLLNEQQCTPVNCASGAYQLSYSYDWVGKPTTATYPSNVLSNGSPLTLTYSYDAAERLLTASSNWASNGDANHPGALFQAPPPNSGLPAYGPMGLMNASLGFNPNSGAIAATVQRGYDDRARVVNGVYAAGGGGVSDSGAAGSITISGSEGRTTDTKSQSAGVLPDPTSGGMFGSGFYECYNYNNFPPTPFPTTQYYTGNVSITVQSAPPFTTPLVTWGEGHENRSDVQSALVSALNVSGSPVTATLNADGTISVISKAGGISANYPVTITLAQVPPTYDPSPPSNCHN